MGQRSEIEDAYEAGGIDAVRSLMGEKPAGSTRLVARVVRYETCTWELDGMWTEEEAIEYVRENGVEPSDSDIDSEDFDVTAFEARRS
jgi:hypothetical protein